MSYVDEIADRLLRPDFERWADQAQQVGHCAQPVRLVGESEVFDAQTGARVGSYSSATEPDGVTYVRCGNRRAVRCPSCSHEYKADMWHLIVAGAAGGSKGVPEGVASHPLVFVTLTAPSFGAIHSFKKPGHGSQRCRPRAKKQLCPHGRPLWCMEKHSDDAALVGEPLCAECYDYPGHIAWQWHAPELWRRFVIRLRRELASRLGMSETATRELVRVQFAKVAEFQRRGVVHFHALVRLDGDPTPAESFPSPTIPIALDQLADMIRSAAAHVELVADPLPGETLSRLLRWGVQCDARPVRRHHDALDGQLTDRAVAAYIAKYATKATEDLTSPASSGTIRPHIARLRRLVAEAGRAALGDDASPYLLLSRWESMLGFRGHFSTKSRRYSTTLGQVRRARRVWQQRRASGARPIADIDEFDDSTLVIGRWSFAGMGWLTAGDAALAAEAAAAAREWDRTRRERSKQTRERSE